MVNQDKIVQVHESSYLFWKQFGYNQMEDSGEDSESQGKAEWEAMELVSFSLDLETKMFPRL